MVSSLTVRTPRRSMICGELLLGNDDFVDGFIDFEELSHSSYENFIQSPITSKPTRIENAMFT